MPKNMENIAYVQFGEVAEAKAVVEDAELEINGVTCAAKFVPDRVSAPRKREKGTKWAMKKEAKREAIVAEKQAAKQADFKSEPGEHSYSSKAA